MVDMWHKVLQWVDHNRWLVAGLSLAILMSVWVVGCQPTTASILNPKAKVTASQLQREMAIVSTGFSKREALIIQMQAALSAEAQEKSDTIAAAIDDLDRQIAMRQQIITAIGGMGQSLAAGTLTPAAGINGVMSLILLLGAGGLGVDNLRKSRVITQLKSESDKKT